MSRPQSLKPRIFCAILAIFGACHLPQQHLPHEDYATLDGNFVCELSRTGISGPPYLTYLERQATKLDPTTLTIWCQDGPPHHFFCPPTRTHIYFSSFGNNFTVFPPPDRSANRERLSRIYPDNNGQTSETNVHVTYLPED